MKDQDIDSGGIELFEVLNKFQDVGWELRDGVYEVFL